MSAIFDPGASEGFKGDRDLTAWQTDAVMKVVDEVEAARAEQWRLRREAEASLDVEKAIVYAMKLSAATLAGSVSIPVPMAQLIVGALNDADFADQSRRVSAGIGKRCLENEILHAKRADLLADEASLATAPAASDGQ